MRDLFVDEVANLMVINCLNQDFQDFRIYRMRDLFVDEVANLMVINCLNQDFQDFRIYRMRDLFVDEVANNRTYASVTLRICFRVRQTV